MTICGMQIKPPNYMSIFCTIFWASIILFPFFFLCCQWWRRCSLALYEVPAATYAKLQKIIGAPNLNTLSLNVNDNGFGAEKAGILFGSVSQSTLRGFSLTNMATNVGIQGDEPDIFAQEAMVFRSLNGVVTNIQWPSTQRCC